MATMQRLGLRLQKQNIPDELDQADGDTMTDILTRSGERKKSRPLADYYTPLKRQPTALLELHKYQPHQSFKRSHTESHLGQA